MSQKPGQLFYVPLYGVAHHANNDMHTLLDHLPKTFHMSKDPCIRDLDDVDALHANGHGYESKELEGDKGQTKGASHAHPNFLPAYLPVVSTDTQHKYAVAWEMQTFVYSTIAYCRIEGDTAKDEYLENMEDLPEPHEPAVLTLLTTRYRLGRFMTKVDERTDVWVNPMRPAEDADNELIEDNSNSAGLMYSHVIPPVSLINAKSVKGIIRFDNPLDTIYNRIEEIQNLALKAGRSQTVCYRGHSGSGKSEQFRLALQYLLFSDAVKSAIKRGDKSIDLQNSNECLSLKLRRDCAYAYFFPPSRTSLAAIASMGIKSAFGTCPLTAHELAAVNGAVGSKDCCNAKTNVWHTAKVVYSKNLNMPDSVRLKQIEFTAGGIDMMRLKVQKRVGEEVTSLPYNIIFMFLSWVSQPEQKKLLLDWKFKPTQINQFLSVDVLTAAALQSTGKSIYLGLSLRLRGLYLYTDGILFPIEWCIRLTALMSLYHTR